MTSDNTKASKPPPPASKPPPPKPPVASQGKVKANEPRGKDIDYRGKR